MYQTIFCHPPFFLRIIRHLHLSFEVSKFLIRLSLVYILVFLSLLATLFAASLIYLVNSWLSLSRLPPSTFRASVFGLSPSDVKLRCK